MTEGFTIHPARYAKNMMAVHVASDGSGWKQRAHYLCDALKARYSGRESAYILSKTKAIRLRKLFDEGWSATPVLNKLIPPAEGK